MSTLNSKFRFSSLSPGSTLCADEDLLSSVRLSSLPHLYLSSSSLHSSESIGCLHKVMTGIYITRDYRSLNQQSLLAKGFTRIITIDKYLVDIQDTEESEGSDRSSEDDDMVWKIPSETDNDGKLKSSVLDFSNDFDVINLNFCGKRFMNTVLPNCLRAIRFIPKALESVGRVLIIDCNDDNQRCLTLVIAYLMHKHDINFNEAYARLRANYHTALLQEVFIRKLREYETVLRVRRNSSGMGVWTYPETTNGGRPLCVARPGTGRGDEVDAPGGFLNRLNPVYQYFVSKFRQRFDRFCKQFGQYASASPLL